MSADWPPVRLGEVMRLDIDAVPVDPSVTYRISGVYSFGKGLLAREPLAGSATTYKVFHRLHTDQFVLSQLKGWEGALARVSADFDGWFLSPQFPTFRADPAALDVRFFEWYAKQPRVWGELRSNARGMGARRDSVSPGQFLGLRIPLPPLAEQRRIVARVEAIAGRVAEAKRLAVESQNEAEEVFSRAADEVFARLESTLGTKRFADFEPHVTSGPRNWAARYTESGTRFYRAQDIQPEGRLSTSGKVFIERPDSDQGRGAQLQPGDLMLVITGATVGRVAEYTAGLEPGYVSQHVAICRLPTEALIPRFALMKLLSARGQTELTGQRYGQGKPGLNLTNIRNLKLPVPPLPEQGRIVAHLDALQAKADALRALQSETAAELDALLPAVLAKAFAGRL